MIDKIFVYGTLRKGYGLNNVFTNRASFLGSATCSNKIMYNLGAFPGVVHSTNKNDIVHGEVYQMYTPEETLNTLDRIEGVPFLYKRECAVVTYEDGSTEEVWIYIYNSKRSSRYEPQIKSGDFIDGR